MHPDPTYRMKFENIVQQTSFGLLTSREQEFIRTKAFEMRFTQQELRQVSDMALDRMRWKEARLSANWPEERVYSDPRQEKKRIFAKIHAAHRALAATDKSYGSFSREDRPSTEKPKLVSRAGKRLGLGMCPVASERTRCCNLMTLDAVQQCGFDCSYCSIQSFYHGNEVAFDTEFASKLRDLTLDPGTIYHIGTGQSSDSLMWGNHHGVLEALCDFARNNPNVLLELKTKSRNIGWLLDNPVPQNVICTWSLNTQPIIDFEEHLTASLAQRMDAAQAMAKKGALVGFHFHPIVHYSGWESDYADIARSLVERFDPDRVAMVSLGTLTFTRSVMKTIRSRDLKSKILQMPLEESAGKLSYPAPMKLELFRLVYDALADWHGRVFFYLCMEPHSLWEPVFGYRYESNEEFENAMKTAYLKKVRSPV